jgi:hypothetical protein
MTAKEANSSIFKVSSELKEPDERKLYWIFRGPDRQSSSLNVLFPQLAGDSWVHYALFYYKSLKVFLSERARERKRWLNWDSIFLDPCLNRKNPGNGHPNLNIYYMVKSHTHISLVRHTPSRSASLLLSKLHIFKFLFFARVTVRWVNPCILIDEEIWNNSRVLQPLVRRIHPFLHR